jgi:hypothetical protein
MHRELRYVYFAYNHAVKADKVGCTKYPEKRIVKFQGYKNYMILESGEWTPEEARDKEDSHKLLRGFPVGERYDNQIKRGQISASLPRTKKQLAASKENWKNMHTEEAIIRSVNIKKERGTNFSWKPESTIKARETRLKKGFKANTSGLHTKEAIEKSAQTRSRPIVQFSSDGTLIRNWTSGKEVYLVLGKQIHWNLKSGNKDLNGFIWKYADGSSSRKYKDE